MVRGLAKLTCEQQIATDRKEALSLLKASYCAAVGHLMINWSTTIRYVRKNVAAATIPKGMTVFKALPTDETTYSFSILAAVVHLIRVDDNTSAGVQEDAHPTRFGQSYGYAK